MFFKSIKLVMIYAICVLVLSGCNNQVASEQQALNLDTSMAADKDSTTSFEASDQSDNSNSSSSGNTDNNTDSNTDSNANSNTDSKADTNTSDSNGADQSEGDTTSNTDNNNDGNTNSNDDSNNDGNTDSNTDGSTNSNTSSNTSNATSNYNDNVNSTTSSSDDGIDEVKPADSNPLPVTITINGPEDEGVIYTGNYTYKENMTVMSLLIDIHETEGLLLDYSGSGDATYINGIDNLYEFDYGPLSGWLYGVNGTFPLKSVGAFQLSPGDEVTFYYTLDNGVDVGARQ